MVIVLEIKTGYIYHIKDDFFDKIKEKMINYINKKVFYISIFNEKLIQKIK